jgi:hypothetical protein
MVILRPGDTEPEIKEFARAPTADELQTAVGGYIELIPGFISLAFGGTVLNCVAFGDEHGKLDHKPINQGATMAWERALRRRGMSLYDDKENKPKDWLVGTIAVLFGDREFMAEL